ncbi:hypothetical protein BZB76_1849 [Actinomadura pelletieri DSM 43383]|uniref:Uncharacterized protein n=1 Tax=Actinomadura pelletieri DSM 43383 TaxID=1120940 RepID=A0A495QSR0_9ACTN|nr:hypothetical protein [Actinomadura pelletieri]RKS76493.1 hypothetical protein BZB76_1849 [Actinomadura pelletieri DSM 43383]
MTATPLDRFTRSTQGDVSWEFANLDVPGGCDRFEWCGGPCGPLAPGALGDAHGRYIASALRESSGDLVEVAVGQWKADPAQPWYLGGCAGAYDNRDREPRVILDVSPSDLERSTRVFLKVGDAAAVASGLRAVGHDRFADALDNAVKFARTIGEGSKR